MANRGFLMLIAAGALISVACDDGAVDRIDNRTDCRQICEAYQQCVAGEDFDEQSCRDECSENALNDSFEDDVDDCENCLDDDASCVENGVGCATECARVIAEST
jgi:hypothetical protein